MGRRKRQAENRAIRVKEGIKAKVDRKAKRVNIFKRAEKYAKEYQDQERDEIRLQRKAKKVLQLFRLRQINNGVFIKLNKATVNMLRICGKWSDFHLVRSSLPVFEREG